MPAQGLTPTSHSWPWITLIGVGVLLAAVYATVISVPAVGLYNDDGIYLVTAKALAEGQGYHIISLPESVPQTKYPLLFPLLLSLVWTVLPEFPGNLPILKLLPLGALLGWLLVAYILLRRELVDPRVALGCTLLCAASPWVFFLSTSLLSETLFALFLWGALLQFRKFEREAPAEGLVILGAVLAAAAFLTRTIGFVVPLTGFLILLWHQKVAVAARFTAYGAVLILPWLLWVWLHRGSGEAVPYYAATNYADWNVLINFAWSEKVLIVLTNAGQILTAPVQLMGWASLLVQPVLIVVSLSAVVGLIVRLRNGIDSISLLLVLYCLVLLLWAWRPVRFMAPMLPLLFALAWNGGRVALDYLKVPRNGQRIAVLAVTGLLFLSSSVVIGREALRAHESGVVCPPNPDCTLRWQAVEEVSDWILANTPPDARLLAHYDPMIFLLTGRKAVRAATYDPVSMLYRDPLSAIDHMPPCYLVERMLAVDAEYLVETLTGRALEEWLLAVLVDRSRSCGQGSLEEIPGNWGSGVRLHRLRH